jgi:hypothetical protein
VREFPTESGPADYVLFVDQKAVGVVEAPRAPEKFCSLGELSNSMLDAIDLAASPALLAFLQERETMIDETSLDQVIAAGLDSDSDMLALAQFSGITEALEGDED